VKLQMCCQEDISGGTAKLTAATHWGNSLHPDRCRESVVNSILFP